MLQLNSIFPKGSFMVDTRDLGRVGAAMALLEGQPILDHEKKRTVALHGLRLTRAKENCILDLFMGPLEDLRGFRYGGGWKETLTRGTRFCVEISTI